ncbi:hypothetical protein CVT25_000595 [Psilocybe cyanescens]|uniref:Uncharacterized protein n=1 Tax=Psilocybe cyanescens TaxID=93625 RepID=A0A409XM29_PSICY|nr:hypothetical protein CVT25_000595 [Psilocybe cyanescens]
MDFVCVCGLTRYNLTPGISKGFTDSGHYNREKSTLFETLVIKSSKLVYLEADFALDNLGLEHSTYTKLSASVSDIVYNAWRLYFNLSITSFDSNIRGSPSPLP